MAAGHGHLLRVGGGATWHRFTPGALTLSGRDASGLALDSLFGARPDSLALLLQELQTVLPPDGR